MGVVFLEDLKLTQKQEAAYRLVCRQRMTHAQAADHLNIKRPAVTRLLSRVAQRAAANQVSLPRRPKLIRARTLPRGI